MYHPEVIAFREHQLSAALGGLTLQRRSHEECWAMRDVLARAVDEKGKLVRDLTAAEQSFINSERLLVKLDFRYWGERYAVINKEAQEDGPLFPLLASQTLLLDRLAEQEHERWKTNHPDGLLFNVGKARQLGISTLTECMLTHRVTTQAAVRTIVIGDVPEQSVAMFAIAELVMDSLPWWLYPGTRAKSTGHSRVLMNRSSHRVAAGKSQRGGLQDRGGAKGNVGRGKSQPLDALVLTPDGWTTMGALHLHDLVIGADGRPTVVTGVFPQGEQPTYRVSFSDGATVECSADHLWSVGMRHRSGDQVSQQVKTTQELLAIGLRGHKGIWKFEIPLVRPVAFSATAPLPLDPYLLGLLIGDGCFAQGQCSFTTDDATIADRAATVLPDGCRLVRRPVTNRTPTYAITGKKANGRSRVRQVLESLGLMGCRAETKQIPLSYRHAGVTDRIRLLQGLFDADGWAERQGAGFTTVSPILFAQVRELVELLGGSVRTYPPRHPKYIYKGEEKRGQLAYRMHVDFPEGIVPFWCARKRDAFEKAWRPRRLRRCITSIELIGLKPSQCIRVSAPDSLYVTAHGIVTHNTYSGGHLTEVSTWERPEQISDGLLPAIPRTPRTFLGRESTSKGRNDYWHGEWKAADRGRSRFFNVFIPWYIEPGKYWLPVPAGWTPSDVTKAHAAAVETDSPKWLLGKTHRLTKEQAYWYESTREEYDARGELHKFLEEYPATPEESFQHAGRSVFTINQLQQIERFQRPPIDVWNVEPAKDIAQLREWERVAAAQKAARG